MKLNPTHTYSALLSCVAAVGSHLSAATIAWQPSVNLYQGSTVETFVTTQGDGLVAVNATNDTTNGNVTVNTVAFTQALNNATVTGSGGESITVNGPNIHGSAFGDGEFTSNANIFHLIQGAAWGATSVDFAGLTIGQEYLIQVFVNDARTSRSLNTQTGFGDGTGSASPVATANNNNSPTDGSTAVFPDTEAGDYIIGTFVADAETQSFNVFGASNGVSFSQGNGAGHVNGIQLRAIPEPSSALLLGLAGSFIALRRRN